MFAHSERKSFSTHALRPKNQPKNISRPSSTAKQFISVITPSLNHHLTIKTIQQIKQIANSETKTPAIRSLEDIFALKDIQNVQSTPKKMKKLRVGQLKKQQKKQRIANVIKLSNESQTSTARGRSEIQLRQESPIHRLLAVSRMNPYFS